MRLSKKERHLIRGNLDLAERFLLDVIKDPSGLKGIPSGSTIILYPVPVKRSGWKWKLPLKGVFPGRARTIRTASTAL